MKDLWELRGLQIYEGETNHHRVKGVIFYVMEAVETNMWEARQT
jgi:hypothetical protein